MPRLQRARQGLAGLKTLQRAAHNRRRHPEVILLVLTIQPVCAEYMDKLLWGIFCPNELRDEEKVKLRHCERVKRSLPALK